MTSGTSDPAGRLRLFRYGVIVVVVVAFIATLFYPYSIAAGAASIGDFFGQAILAAIIAAVIGAAAYIGYTYFLTKKFPWAK